MLMRLLLLLMMIMKMFIIMIINDDNHDKNNNTHNNNNNTNTTTTNVKAMEVHIPEMEDLSAGQASSATNLSAQPPLSLQPLQQRRTFKAGAPWWRTDGGAQLLADLLQTSPPGSRS